MKHKGQMELAHYSVNLYTVMYFKRNGLYGYCIFYIEIYSQQNSFPCFSLLFLFKTTNINGRAEYLGVLISLWFFLFSIFLFATQSKDFFLDGLKKLEQRSHKYVELSGEYVE
jgi:hypothetical protein